MAEVTLRTMVDASTAMGIKIPRYEGQSGWREFRANFGCSPGVCAVAYRKCGFQNHEATPTHFLWGLLLLFSYDTESRLASRVNTTRKTFRKWVWFVIPRLTRVCRQLVSIRLAGGMDTGSTLSLSSLLGLDLADPMGEQVPEQPSKYLPCNTGWN
jgi:hypothetical protein